MNLLTQWRGKRADFEDFILQTACKLLLLEEWLILFKEIGASNIGAILAGVGAGIKTNIKYGRRASWRCWSASLDQRCYTSRRLRNRNIALVA